MADAIVDDAVRTLHVELLNRIREHDGCLFIDDVAAALSAARPLIEAEATAKERERCAKVAEAHVSFDWTKLPNAKADYQPGIQIAATIREGG